MAHDDQNRLRERTWKALHYHDVQDALRILGQCSDRDRFAMRGVTVSLIEYRAGAAETPFGPTWTAPALGIDFDRACDLLGVAGGTWQPEELVA